MTTVLFVDDEINILKSIKRAVLDEKFDAQFALSGQEALAILENEPVGVIVTDMRMPGMDGLALLKRVKEKHPEIVRIVLSGYTQLPQVIATINQGEIFQYITKPWKMEDELLSVVKRAIEYYEVHCKEATHRKSIEQRVAGYQNIFREMENKIANIKNDFYSAKIINAIVFELIKKDCSESNFSKEALMQRVNMLETAVQSYLGIIPLQPVKIEAAKLIQSIIEKLEHSFTVQDKSNADKQGELICTGNNYSMHWALDILMQQLQLSKGQVHCQVYSQYRKSGDYQLGVVLHVVMPKQEVDDSFITSTEYVVDMIKRIAKGQFVSIECSKGNDAIAIMLSGDFKVIS